jgi:hypothetical protein
VLEVMSEDVCETGLFEVDEGWTLDQEDKERKKLAACEGIRHQYVRMAVDSPNVRFLEAMVRAAAARACALHHKTVCGIATSCAAGA